MKTEEQEPSKQAKRSAPPRHDGEAIQTIILLAGVVGLAAVLQNGFSGLHEEMDAMRQDMDAMRTELKGELQSLRMDIKCELDILRSELKAALRGDSQKLADRTRACEVAVIGNDVRLDLERVHAIAYGPAEDAPPRNRGGAWQRARTRQSGNFLHATGVVSAYAIHLGTAELRSA